MPYSIANHPQLGDQERDAIHVPILQVRLTDHALPGSHLHVFFDGYGWLATNPTGSCPANAVADPFKPPSGEAWIPGTTIWVFAYPKNITLTHVWESPEFPQVRPAAFSPDEECRNCY